MRKVSEQELNRMALKGGAKVKRKPVSRVPTDSEIAAQTPTEAPVRTPDAPPDSSIPFASMQASMGHINEEMRRVVDHNSQVMVDLKTSLGKDPPARKPWRLRVKRSPDKLIEYVDAIPVEFKT